jgi:hypothetical protein
LLLGLAWQGRIFAVTGQVQAAAGSGSIAGVVVSVRDRAPIAYATVTLQSMRDDAATAGAEAHVLADAAGRWSFRNLPAGVYAISASATGFLDGFLGQRAPGGPFPRITLGDHDAALDLRLQLWPHAVITGAVRDDFGDPLVNTPVEAFRRMAQGGSVRYVQAATYVRTDDLGAYRIAGLPPGDYVVAAATMTITSSTPAAAALTADQFRQQPERTEAIRRAASDSGIFNATAPGMRVGSAIIQSGTLSGNDLMPPPAAPGQRQRVFPRTFYPSASGASNAQLITLRAGEERPGMDLRLQAVPAVRVAGTVTGPSGPEPLIGLSLTHVSQDALSAYGGTSELALFSAVTDQAGRFEFPAVTTGQYVLQVLKIPRVQATPRSVDDPSLWATMPVVVGDADVTKLAVTLRQGLHVAGTVAFDSEPPAARDVERMAITLQPADAAAFPRHVPGAVKADRAFRTIAYPAGRYIVSLSGVPAGWTLTSMVADGRDVLSAPLELKDADVTGVTITFSNRPSRLTGVVRQQNGLADSEATVLVFPVDATTWLRNGASTRLSRELRTGRSGEFSASGLPPGDYLVVVAGEDLIGHWQSSSSLTALARLASRVTLRSGQVTTENLVSVRR